MSRRIPNRWILPIVCEIWGVDEAEIKGPGRQRKLTEPRQVAFWLSALHGENSLTVIGRFYGRDHTTVWHGVQMVMARLGRDPGFSHRVQTAVQRVVSLRPIDGPDCLIGWPAPVRAEARFQRLGG